jgi:hypothetical protein
MSSNAKLLVYLVVGAIAWYLIAGGTFGAKL